MSKVAVVTGAGSGIGRRTVERLLAVDWSVWALDMVEDGMKALESELAVGDRLRHVVCDITDPDSVARAFGEIGTRESSLDALICSAGYLVTGAMEDITYEQAMRMTAVNFLGPWVCVREALPLLRMDSTVDDPARVVIIGSIGGLRPKVGNGVYSATKAALHALTGVYAMELAPSGVIVNVVAPGTVATPMNAAVVAPDAPASAFKPSGVSPLGRIAQPDDISDVILFFLSDSARYVNGTILPVDGGTRAAFLKT